MKKLILHLPKYRLAISYRLIKRRRSALDEPIIPTRTRLNLKYRVGGYTRKLFRHFFEHKSIKKLLGTNIALMLVFSSFIPTNSIVASSNEEVIMISNSDIPLHTNISIQNPVRDRKITQGYKLFHPGLDLDGITGEPIKTIKNGKVETAEYSSVGYGKHVIVDHGNNLKSLYAHLSEISVSEGDEVTTDTILGKMGSTGYSNGDHLHLEVRDHGIPVNPLSVLPDK